MLTLFEHEKKPFPEVSRHLAALARLNQAMGDDILLPAFDRAGRPAVQATQYVGVVRLGRETVQILPKIYRHDAQAETEAARNLLHLLAVAHNLPVREHALAPLLSRPPQNPASNPSSLRRSLRFRLERDLKIWNFGQFAAFSRYTLNRCWKKPYPSSTDAIFWQTKNTGTEKMNENQSQTESLLDIIKGVDNASIALPKFQRDFRWELDKTYDLFDSLIKDIFIGTIIYGKPSFGMTLREIDQRPRKGKGSSAPLKIDSYTTSEIKQLAQTKNLRIVLDGQQRLTSIYRAIKGLDHVFVVLKEGLHVNDIPNLSLEDMLDHIEGADDPTAISIKFSDAYKAELETLEDEDIKAFFYASAYAKAKLFNADKKECKDAEKVYRRALRRIVDLFKQQKMVAFYLLDMSLDKFCLFFERSNSRGIQLNFTDILAAKLYHGFNLRKEIENFEAQSKFTLNREIVVRAIAYFAATDGNRPIKIDKKAILENLDANDFKIHWFHVCKL